MIILDASVVLGLVNSGDALHHQAVALMRAVAAEPLGMSPLTLAEVLVGPARQGQLRTAESLLSSLGIEAVALPADAGPRLAGIRATTNLRLPDCCVILAAEQTSAELASFDPRLLRGAAHRGIATLPRSNED